MYIDGDSLNKVMDYGAYLNEPLDVHNWNVTQADLLPPILDILDHGTTYGGEEDVDPVHCNWVNRLLELVDALVETIPDTGGVPHRIIVVRRPGGHTVTPKGKRFGNKVLGQRRSTRV